MILSAKTGFTMELEPVRRSAPGLTALSGCAFGEPDLRGGFATETGPRASRPDDERPRHLEARTDWWSTGPGRHVVWTLPSGSWC